MSSRSRRAAAMATIVLVALASLIWSYYAGDWLFQFAQRYLAQGGPVSRLCGLRPDSYAVDAHPYYAACWIALVGATGVTAGILVAIPQPGFRRRAWMYLAFLAVVLPATLFNYMQGDLDLRRSVQVALNVALIALSAIVAAWVAQAPATAQTFECSSLFVSPCFLRRASLCRPCLLYCGALLALTFLRAHKPNRSALIRLRERRHSLERSYLC